MIRVLALIESSRVTGKAKSLIEFGIRARRRGASGAGAELAIATFQRGNIAPNAFTTAARNAELPVFTLQEERRYDPNPLRQLPRVIDEWQPNVVETHNVKSHFLVRLLGLARKQSWVAFHHGYTATDLKDTFYNQFDRWSLRAAERVVTVCGPFAQLLVTMGVSRERIRVQHNSVPPFVAPPEESVSAVRNRLAVEARKIVLVIGRLSREKGHQDLLQAVELLRSTGALQDTCFVVLGDGPERGHLFRRISEHRLQDGVILAGHQVDVRPYYAMASLLALPSHTEGCPYAVLEAMAAGVPVIATAVGGVPEIIAHEQTGILVPARRPEAMARAVEGLLGDEFTRRKIADVAQAAVLSRYSPEAHFQARIETYCELLGQAAYAATLSRPA
jgi:glycosyltransferase involved in cell wall biosynthesis